MLRAVLVIVTLLAAGCVGSPPEDIARAGTGASAARPIVVAVIDSGTNPYLPVFSNDAAVLDLVPGAIELAGLRSEGTLEDRIAADAEVWDVVRERQLYRVAGTRLLTISFDAGMQQERAVFDHLGHGALTTALVAREAPDALILSVKVNLTGCDLMVSCLYRPGVADAMEWIAAQPWIDVLSSSIGFIGNGPDPSALHPEAAEWVAASEAASAAGMTILNAAGNEVVPGLTHYYNGPPWVIAVGGVQSQNRGEHATASKAVDIVANYSEYLIVPGSMDEMAWFGGTSIATPVAAGAVAHALGVIRERAPDLVLAPGALRDAVNASAHMFSATDWDPRPVDRGDPIASALFYTSLPVVAQAQVGWGYVNGSISEEIARRVIENDLAPPAGKEQAALFQAEYQRAREEFWARYR